MSLILQTGTSLKWGTPGEYILNGAIYLKTLEPALPGFPAGEYILQIYFSPKHGFYVPRFISPTDPTFADRCIENHPGNIFADTDDCVLVGDGYDDIDCAAAYPLGDPRHNLGVIPGLTNSRKTFERMMNDGKIYLGKPDGKGGYVGGTNITVIRAAA